MPTTDIAVRADFTLHPLVHTREYEETLYFVLLRLEEPKHEPVVDQIREMLSRIGVHYTCEYSVFGYWDAFIRVWLNHTAFERLRSWLDQKNKSKTNVGKFEIFITSEIRYLWSGSEENLLVDNREISKALGRRKKIVNKLVKDPDGLTDDEWQALHEDGLVIDRQQTEVDYGAIKFYIALERFGGDLTSVGELGEVIGAIRSCDLSSRSTLYVGTSEFAAYLIRCATDDYGEVLEIAERLDIALVRTKLRSMTIPLANTDARESDLVNHPKALSLRAERVLLDLGFDEEALAFADHDDHEWEALDELLQLTYELAEGDDAIMETCRAVLAACLKDDQDELAKAASTLADSEWFVGKYTIYAWRDSLGENWYQVLKDNFSKSPGSQRSFEELEKGEDAWTAGSYAHMALETALFSDKFDGQLRRQLGEDWKNQFTRYYNRRNEPGHGRLRNIPNLAVFGEPDHVLRLRELIETCAFCWRARRVVEVQQNV